MKHFFHLLIFTMTLPSLLQAQSGAVGIGTTSPNPKSILDVASTNKGILIPRMPTVQRLSLSAGLGDEGLTVYDVDLHTYMYYNGTDWRHIGESIWELDGSTVYYDGDHVRIGTSLPQGKFHLENDDINSSLYIQSIYDGTIQKYGINNVVTQEGTNTKFGIDNLVTANASASEFNYGIRSRVDPNGSGGNKYGLWSEVLSGGSGSHYAIYGRAFGANNYAIYGINSDANGWAARLQGRTYISDRLGLGDFSPSYKLDIDSDLSRAINIVNNYSGAGDTYGVRAQINDGGTSGKRYGFVSDVNLDPGHTANAWGMLINVENEGTGTRYGLVANAGGDGNYAVYGINNATNGWAGYFTGRGYFGNNVEINNKIKLKPQGHGQGGEIEMYDDNGTETIQMRAGQTTTNGAEIILYKADGTKTIELDAEWGDGGPGRIVTDELQITGGSDLAEYFDITSEDSKAIVPGMAVSIDPKHTGKLTIARSAYDKAVVGVISGADGINPGLLMSQDGSIADGEHAVAIAGRVSVLADARFGKIRPGDFLTTSPRAGYVMKATNKKRASGAVIGKAMSGLEKGEGHVLILINLQ